MTMFSFDHYNQSEIPTFSLVNPDGTILYNLGTIYDRNFELRYNTLSTLTFTAPSQINNVNTDYYDFLEYRRLVYVDGIGNFMITGIEIENDGIVELKKITCKSLEVVLSYKKISLFQGTYNFYDPINPFGTLLNVLLSYIPGWTLDEVDANLLGIYRTFDVTDKTLYDFMINEISQTYQCIFVFDSINKTISAYSITAATTVTDIFIGFDNLMKSFTIEESTEELITAMTVLGGKDLSINLVNPLGTNIIYNFDYYKTAEWMNQNLIDALNTWETKITYYQPTYANLLTDLREENEILITLQSELVDLQSELDALIITRDVRIQQGLSVADINIQIAAQEALITSKESEIIAQEAVIVPIQAELSAINADLLFENNFTEQELINLNNFIIGNTYTNTNFIETDIMTEVQVQEMAQNLYDQGITVLEKISQPRYIFTIDSANFIFIKDFEPFINQLSLGCIITVELKEDNYVYPVLLGLDFNYDNPTQFKMVLSNRLRFDDEEFQYNDLFSSMVDSSNTTNFNSQKWNSLTNSYANLVSTSNNIVVSSTTSNTNNFAVFADESGMIIKDAEVIYTPPTSFTPSFIADGTTFTYSYQVGYYSIVGRILFFELDLSLASVSGSTTGSVYITLPVLSKNVTNLYPSFIPICQNITLDSGYTGFCCTLDPNTSYLSLCEQRSANTITNIVVSKLGASTAKLFLSGYYIIN